MKTVSRALDTVTRAPWGREYDVAFSFAGEDREIARRIAAVARANGLRVYIDEHHLWESWGRDLTEYLGRIYDEAAQYCVILISQDYVSKPYTIHERRIALARALQTRREYVLPVLLDDAWPPGLPRTTAYLDLRQMSPERVGEILVRKIRESPDQTLALPAPRPCPIQVVEDTAALPGPRGGAAQDAPLDFAFVGIATECKTWEETEAYARQANRKLEYMTDKSLRSDQTSALAYRFWEEAGRPAGREGEFWCRGEKALGRQLVADSALHGALVRPLS